MRSGECGISEKNGSAGATRTGDPSVSARFARGGLDKRDMLFFMGVINFKKK
jgi:hypothetical protein